MKEIWTSKKGFITVLAIIALTVVTVTSIVTSAGWIDQTMFWATLSSILAPYLVAQGIADYGQTKNGNGTTPK